MKMYRMNSVLKVTGIALTFLFLISSCTVKKRTNLPDKMYSVVWQYKIKPEHREKFEREYGANGTWVNLFKKSSDYYGSYLHKSDAEDDVYLLIDTWKGKEQYEAFVQTNNEVYQSLSKQFEGVYETEEKMGAYNSLN